jgi:hypothetical protein
LVALGASGLQTVQAQGLLGPDDSKPWSVALTLRGFYDDNPSASARGTERESLGYEVSPSFKVGWTLPQSTIVLGYTYSFKQYEERPLFQEDKDTHTHNFNAAFDHRFSERFSMKASDSFVVGQEPDLLRSGAVQDTFQPIQGDNIRNFGRIVFNGQLTSTFGMQVGYDNAYYNYDDDGPASISSRLDRMEHGIPVEGIFQLQPETQGILGYRYRQVNYDSDEFLDITETLNSDQRNVRTHTLYAGLNHEFNPGLSGSVRAGAQYADYYEMPDSDGEYSPYAEASLRWTYAEESFLEGGFTYDLSATDLVGDNGTSFTTDSEAAVLYANWTHRLAPKVYGTLMGSFQNSSLQGGSYDDETEQYYSAGLNVEYRFNKNISAHVGYSFDKLESDVDGRNFDRNRVYMGVTARY